MTTTPRATTTTTTTVRVATTTEAMTEAEATASQKLANRGGRPNAEAAAAYAGELFIDHGRMVVGLCRLLLRDRVEAEDASQQVFVSAHRALLSGAVPREPAAWLAAIARNECRARVRARMREPLTLPQLPPHLADPLASAADAGDLDALWSALSAMPRRQRNAFLLRELGGLSIASSASRSASRALRSNRCCSERGVTCATRSRREALRLNRSRGSSPAHRVRRRQRSPP